MTSTGRSQATEIDTSIHRQTLSEYHGICSYLVATATCCLYMYLHDGSPILSKHRACKLSWAPCSICIWCIAGSVMLHCCHNACRQLLL